MLKSKLSDLKYSERRLYQLSEESFTDFLSESDQDFVFEYSGMAEELDGVDIAERIEGMEQGSHYIAADEDDRPWSVLAKNPRFGSRPKISAFTGKYDSREPGTFMVKIDELYEPMEKYANETRVEGKIDTSWKELQEELENHRKRKIS